MGQHTGTPKSWRFCDEELAILDAAKAKAGSYKGAVMAALRLYLADKPSWPDQLRRLADELERR
jgi:hypothetical protein